MGIKENEVKKNPFGHTPTREQSRSAWNASYWQAKRAREAQEQDKKEEKDREAWENSQAQKRDGEERPAEKEIAVTLENLRWDKDQGAFNEKATALLDVILPEKYKNVKRIEFKLIALLPDGKREQVDKKEAYLKDGKASQEVTLFYPQYRTEGGQVLTECEYIFAAKHPHSREAESEKLSVLGKDMGRFVEVRDILFDLNSAVMLLSGANEKELFLGADTLATALAFAQSHPDQVCRIFGHTDTSGQDAMNMELSKLRAENVAALLQNESGNWVNIAMSRSSPETQTKLLKAFHLGLDYDCDPEASTADSIARADVLGFQVSYNESHEDKLKEDGLWGAKTWAAMFTLIQEQVDARLKDKGLERNAIRLAMSSQDGGTTPCGEMFPIEAKEKNNFVSQKNRRVEIAFFDQAKEPKKERKEIIIKPIVIKATPIKKLVSGNLTGMTLWCAHSKKDKEGKPKRVAEGGAALEIVPDGPLGDPVNLEATFDKDPSDIRWQTSGWLSDKKRGKAVQIKVNSYTTPAEKLMPVNGVWAPGFKPHEVLIQGKDSKGKTIEGKIFAYSNSTLTYKFKINEMVEKLKAFSDKLGKSFKFFGREVEIEYCKGEINISGGFQEDPNRPEAFFGFKISGGFSPLIGSKLKIPIPIKGIAEIIPNDLMDYAANIKAEFELNGKVDATIDLARSGLRDYVSNGTIKGSFLGGLSLKVVVGNEKLLSIEARVGSGFECPGKIFLKAENNFEKWKAGLSIKVDYNGFTGKISWKIWDGKWTKDKPWTFYKGRTLLDEQKFDFF